MRLVRQALPIATLLALAACDVFGSDSRPLKIEGTVTAAFTNQPIAGATVSIGYGNIFNGESGSLPDRTTDAQGRFTAQIDEIRGYAHVNCTAVGVTATAPGYHSNGIASIQGPEDDRSCESGRAQVTISLTPQQQ